MVSLPIHLVLLTGCGGVEICCDGSGPYPALRFYGRLPHWHAGRLCWKAHRTQHGLKTANGHKSPASNAMKVEVEVLEAADAVIVLSASFGHKPWC